jgi:hypothetical protein
MSERRTTFKYVNSLDRKYNNMVADIKSVTFFISRYGQYCHTLNFEKAVTEKEAIDAVEEYLSHTVTQEHFDSVKDDLFWGSRDEPWTQYHNRGELLSDCKFLEDITVESKTSEGKEISLWCGS